VYNIAQETPEKPQTEYWGGLGLIRRYLKNKSTISHDFDLDLAMNAAQML
jgi:hypothetical protein